MTATQTVGQQPDQVLAAARAGDGEAFKALVAPHVAALHVHCYRMLGSLDDADDAVQEALLSAWRSLDGYEGRAPLQHWLYRITTTTSLKMIRTRSRRPATTAEISYLQPYPDRLLDKLTASDGDPAAIGERRESVILAFIAALQLLPARQRAVLILPQADRFGRSRELLAQLIGWLDGDGSAELSHAELEDQLTVRGREVQRQLLQDHLDLRAVREERLPEVTGQDDVVRRHAEFGHERALATVFGQVTATRIAYRAEGADSRCAADAVLNLPAGKHSHGLRRLAALQAATGSFEQAQTVIEQATGVVVVGKPHRGARTRPAPAGRTGCPSRLGREAAPCAASVAPRSARSL